MHNKDYSWSQERRQLSELREQSRDGVVRFNEDMYKKYMAIRKRDYTLVVFLDANQVRGNPQLKMEQLRKEYGLCAKAFSEGPDQDSLYFVDFVFEESQNIFRLLQAQQLPFVFIFGNDLKATQSSININKANQMTFENMGAPYPWKAEDMAKFIAARGFQHAEIVRPNFYKSTQFKMYVLAALVGLVLAVYFMYMTGVLHHPFIYALGSILIFWFSVGGGMFNIIRGMPFFIYDKDGKMQFFLSRWVGHA